MTATATATATTTIDLTDVELFAANRHHDAFRRLREEAPVYRNPSADGTEFWALTRYDDILAAYIDHDTFSSMHGAILGGSFRQGGDTASGEMLVASDPPRHRILRKVMHPPFAPAMVQRIQESVRTLLTRAVRDLREAGGCDFALDFAPLLPIGALMAMFTIGAAEARHVVGLTRRMVGYRDAALCDLSGDERLRLAHAQSEIFEFFADLLDERGDATGDDDVIGMLQRAEINGEPLTEAQLLYNCMNIAVGGNETTSYTICSGFLAFLENPREWNRLRAEPALLPGALDEMLRWGSTNAYVQRVALRDVVVAGTAIAAGDVVTLWNVSANRDPSQFPEPERFDITRSPNRHLSFGSGVHRCIGAPAGLVELAEAVCALRDSGLGFRLAGDPVRLRSNFILGFTSLPIEIAEIAETAETGA
ncbi:cytochrome P450 [Catenulispora subtropica]|uniref:Cytochrome P450 n=1 Tax=Catenulispora subtropica TaxID=450798 RepID=A0ABP5DNA5_9ACTN